MAQLLQPEYFIFVNMKLSL